VVEHTDYPNWDSLGPAMAVQSDTATAPKREERIVKAVDRRLIAA